jgi:holo-[acyl-carrier protein] synthase
VNIRIGTDIVYVPRIRLAVERFGDRFLQRIYTPGEQQDCLQSSPAQILPPDILRLAGRWAAKEAVVKALGTGWVGIPYLDVEIRRLATGAPGVCLHRKAAHLAEAKLGEGQWHLSLSHDTDYAVAMVVFHCQP